MDRAPRVDPAAGAASCLTLACMQRCNASLPFTDNVKNRGFKAILYDYLIAKRNHAGLCFE